MPGLTELAAGLSGGNRLFFETIKQSLHSMHVTQGAVMSTRLVKGGMTDFEAVCLPGRDFAVYSFMFAQDPVRNGDASLRILTSPECLELFYGYWHYMGGFYSTLFTGCYNFDGDLIIDDDNPALLPRATVFFPDEVCPNIPDRIGRGYVLKYKGGKLHTVDDRMPSWSMGLTAYAYRNKLDLMARKDWWEHASPEEKAKQRDPSLLIPGGLKETKSDMLLHIYTMLGAGFPPEAEIDNNYFSLCVQYHDIDEIWLDIPRTLPDGTAMQTIQRYLI